METAHTLLPDTKLEIGDSAVFEYDGMQTSTINEHQGARHAVCTRLEGNASSLFLGRVAQANNRKYYHVNDCFYYKVI